MCGAEAPLSWTVNRRVGEFMEVAFKPPGMSWCNGQFAWPEKVSAHTVNM